MKKSLLVFVALLLLGGLANAQILEGFNTSHSLGIFKDAAWGTLTDSIYQAADPTGKTPGVMAVAFNLKGTNDHNAIRPVTQVLISDTHNALYLTYWFYIPSSSTIPDSLVFGIWWQPALSWNWNEVYYYAKDIPKGMWYPLSVAIVDSSIADSSKDYLPGHGLGDFGIQWNNGNCQSTVWKGLVYVDSVSLLGAKPTIIGDFKTDLQGFANQWHNGWADSTYWSAGPVGDSSGVAVFELKNGSASTGWTSFGFQPSGAGLAAHGQNALVFWVYVPQSFPDTFHIQTWAQSDPSWNWPPFGPRDYAGKIIPKQKWYPLYFDLAQASLRDTVSGSYFNTFNNLSQNLRKLGIQVGGNAGVTWSGKIYVKSVQLVNHVVAVPTAKPIWVVANFDSAAKGGKQGFYVPSYASGSVQRYLDLTTSKPGYVLQGSLNISPAAPKFAAVRDSIAMAKADSIATDISFDIYLPTKMPNKAVVKFFVSGGASDSVAVVDTVGSQVKHAQWNTIWITKLDSLANVGKFDPTKPAKIGVLIYYPAPYDTMNYTGNIEFDNLTIYGIWYDTQAPSGVKEGSGVVRQFELYNNYPNPFNPSTRIKYDVERDSKVQIRVYDVVGREVATLVNERQAAGSYEVEFNASKLSSGVYFFRMDAGSFVKSQKMILLK